MVFTGKMTSGERSDMEDAARALGATIASSVTKSVDFLVAGPGAGSKLTKAQKYNITVLDEAAYLKLIPQRRLIIRPSNNKAAVILTAAFIF